MNTSLKKSDIIEKLIKEIEKLEKDFSEILLNKKNLEQELYIFKLEYDSKIAPFYLQKLKIDLQINEILKKRGIPLDRFEKDNSYHPEIIDDEMFDAKKDYFENQEEEKERIELNIKNMSKEDTIELKKLYKKLAMKFHPDKFIGQSEKQQKALELMKNINNAFQEQNLEKLQKIEFEGFDLQDIEKQFDENQLIIKKNDLENNIESIRIEIVQIGESGLYHLYKSYIEIGTEDFYSKIIESIKKDTEEANKLFNILEQMPIKGEKMN